MFKRFKNLRAGPLITQVLISLAYPAVKAVVAEGRPLLVFTDALTIISLLLIISGVIYSLVLKGDFDISGFVMKRGFMRDSTEGYQVYKENRKQKSAEAFNYPLFLGLCYLAVCAVLAYGFL